MTSLFDSLPILDVAVPALPGKLGAVSEEAQGYERAVRDLLENLEEKAAQARELSARIRAALEELQSGVSDDRERLLAAAEAVEEAVDGAVKAVEDGRSELVTSLDNAGDAMGELKQALGEAGTRVQAAQQEADQALDALAEATRTGQAEVEGGLEAVESAGDAVETAVDQGTTVLEEAVETLSERMTTYLAEARSQLDAAEARLSELRSQHESQVDEAVAESASRKDQIVEDLRARAQTDLRQRIDQSLGEIGSALGQMGQTVIEAQDSARSGREVIEQLLEAVAERIPPLNAGVVSVKKAADQVGITWQ